MPRWPMPKPKPKPKPSQAKPSQAKLQRSGPLDPGPGVRGAVRPAISPPMRTSPNATCVLLLAALELTASPEKLLNAGVGSGLDSQAPGQTAQCFHAAEGNPAGYSTQVRTSRGERRGRALRDQNWQEGRIARNSGTQTRIWLKGLVLRPFGGIRSRNLGVRVRTFG